MWIKICGNTSLADAQHAANSGASAVGFVLAPSPRHVTVDQIRAISPHLPRNVERIGGLRIIWTSNLADHLRLHDDDTRLSIFHHATFLHYQKSW